MAEYHGAARTVGGCAIYVRWRLHSFAFFISILTLINYMFMKVNIIQCSDKPGHHDFNLLKKLVLPDGSILRAKLPGRPTRDCLFTDPTRDGTRLLIFSHITNL